jgi:hypothetical protein
MKTILAVAILSMASTAWASCVGSGSFQSCTDSSGNSYSVQRYGNSTYMQGSNAQTGSTWSQNSTTSGNTTFVQGTDSRGGSWNNTIQTSPGGNTFQSGTDSRGNSFSRSCNRYGCN